MIEKENGFIRQWRNESFEKIVRIDHNKKRLRNNFLAFPLEALVDGGLSWP
jgi:hypothetical protein